MPMTRINMTGPEAQACAISNLLTSLSGIEPVDEVGDLMSLVDDEDASSAVRSVSAAGVLPASISMVCSQHVRPPGL